MIRQLIFLGIVFLAGTPTLQAKSAGPQDENKKSTDIAFGDNIIRLSPVKVVDIGVGPGISYEKIISADKKVSIVLPFSLQLLHNGYDDFGWHGPNESLYFKYLYFNPGLKFYPFGQRKVTYAIGPNLIFGYGGGKVWASRELPIPGGGSAYYYEFVKQRTLRLGIVVNNYVNFQLNRNFNLGISLGFGVRYLDHEVHQWKSGNVSYQHPMIATGQISFSFGYRF